MMRTPDSIYDLNTLFIQKYSFETAQELLAAFAVGNYFKVEEVVITSEAYGSYDENYQAIKFAGNIRVKDHRIYFRSDINIECAIESYDPDCNKTVVLSIVSSHRIIDGKVVTRYFPVVKESITGNMVPDEPGVSYTYKTYRKGVFDFKRMKFQRFEFTPKLHKTQNLGSVSLQAGDNVALTIRNNRHYQSAIVGSCVEFTDEYIKLKILGSNFLTFVEWKEDCYETDHDGYIEDVANNGVIYPKIWHSNADSTEDDVPVVEFFLLIEMMQKSNFYGQTFSYLGSRVVYENRSGYFISSKIDPLYSQNRSIQNQKRRNIDPYPFATPQPNRELDSCLTGVVNVCKVV
jgi:hypothetical protein